MMDKIDKRLAASMARLLKAAIKQGYEGDWDAVADELFGTRQDCSERAYPPRGGWPECVRCRSNKWVRYGFGDRPWACTMCYGTSCDGKTWEVT